MFTRATRQGSLFGALNAAKLVLKQCKQRGASSSSSSSSSASDARESIRALLALADTCHARGNSSGRPEEASQVVREVESELAGARHVWPAVVIEEEAARRRRSHSEDSGRE